MKCKGKKKIVPVYALRLSVYVLLYSSRLLLFSGFGGRCFFGI